MFWAMVQIKKFNLHFFHAPAILVCAHTNKVFKDPQIKKVKKLTTVKIEKY